MKIADDDYKKRKQSGNIPPGIYKRKSDNRWVYMADLPSKEPGKRNRKPYYAPKGLSDSEAIKYLKSIKIEVEFKLQNNIYRDPGNATIKDLIHEYNNHPRKIADTTKALYKMYEEVHVVPNIGHIKLREILPADIEKFYDQLMAEPRNLSPNTIAKIHSFLHGAFRFAVKNNIVLTNVIDSVECPEEIPYEAPIPNDQQFLKLWKAVEGTFDEVAIVLAGVMTLSRGEICGIKRTDIDRVNQKISVNETYTRFDKNIRKGPKARSRKRTIFAPKFVFDVIDRYEATLTESEKESVYLCPYKPQSYTKHFSNLCKAHGMERITLHKMRHYAAVIMSKIGIPDKSAQGRTGHSQVATLQETYQHFTDEMDKMACDKIEEFFTTLRQ